MRLFSISLICCAMLCALPSQAANKKNRKKAPPQTAPAASQQAMPAAPGAATPAPTTTAPTSAAPFDEPLPPLPPDEDEPSTPPSEWYAPHNLQLSARLGPSFPQLYNKLSTNFLAQVDVAYQFSWRDQALGIFFGVGYTQPGLTGVQTDPRIDVNGGADAYTLVVRDVGLSLGAQYFLQLPKRFVGYAGLGVELHLSRSALWQKAGTVDMGYTYENSTRGGPLVRLGAGYPLGPGLVCLELRQEYTGINHALTGLKNTAALSTQLGYTFKL